MYYRLNLVDFNNGVLKGARAVHAQMRHEVMD